MFRELLDSLLTPSSARRARHAASPPKSCRLSFEALEDRQTPAALLSVADATIIEGHDGSRNAVVTVSLSEPHGNSVTVDYDTTDLTAAAGIDYTAVSGKLTFARGQLSQSILIPVRGDRLAEGDEYFLIQISNAKGAKISIPQATVTISDDEPRVFVEGASVAEGNSGSTLLSFTIRLVEAYDQDVTVSYATADDTALAGEDYISASGTLTFKRGETVQTITVEVFGDATAEPDEYFLISLTDASSNAILYGPSAYGTIQDDDGYVLPDYGGYYSDPYSYWPGYYWY